MIQNINIFVKRSDPGWVLNFPYKDPMKDTDHTTFLDVINGTGEINLRDDQHQQSLPPKPKPEILTVPYEQM